MYVCTVAAKKILTWRNSVETGKCYHGFLIFRYKHIMLISVDASWREKHIGTIPSALSLFYQKLKAKNECDESECECEVGSLDPTW